MAQSCVNARRRSATGTLTPTVVDANGAAISGYVGAQHQPLITFTANPGQSVRIPLLVGTASFSPRLGYSLPAASWRLVVPLDLADVRQLVTRPKDFTITE